MGKKKKKSDMELKIIPTEPNNSPTPITYTMNK